MNPWAVYDARLEQKGHSKREAHLNRLQNHLRRLYPDSVFYHEIAVFEDVYSPERIQGVTILDSDNLNMKTIVTIPGEDILCGSTVFWKDHYWLVTEVDANKTVYTKATMQQCNYLLRWVTPERKVVERNCIVEDGTKYLTGEIVSSYNDVGIAIGDTRISVTLPRDRDTLMLNRDNRFLIDDYGSGNVLAYQLTKPFKVGGVYGDAGVLRFVMQEVNTEDTDDLIRHIANYYSYFPREEDVVSGAPEEQPDTEGEPGKKVWL